MAERISGMSEQTWHEERIEGWNAGRGTVFVFRWVPDFAPYDGRRAEHPNFDEWLDDMRGAAAGLDGPTVTHREAYDTVEYGVSGHRPMSAEERAVKRAELERDAAGMRADIDLLATS